jgi:WD40 repeat protein
MAGYTNTAPDGKPFPSGRSYHALGIFETRTGKELYQVSNSSELSDRCHVFAFSPDNSVFAAGPIGNEGNIFYFWEAATGKKCAKLVGPDNTKIVYEMVFSPDGKTLALRLMGKELELYDVSSRTKLQRVSVAREPHPLDEKFAFKSAGAAFNITSMAFSQDSKLIAIGNDDGNVDLWDVATRQRGAHIGGGPRPLIRWERRPVQSLAFSPDGRCVLTSNGALIKDLDAGLRLWEVASNKTILRIVEPSIRTLRGFALSHDGKTLAVSGEEPTVVAVWNLPATLLGRKPTGEKLTPADLETRWTDLASADPGKAYAAIWTLAAVPGQSVPLLKERLKPVSRALPTAQLIADLDSDQFAIRQKAMQDLEGLGELARPALSEALAGKPSKELRASAELLLERLGKPIQSPKRLLAIRACALLEEIATPEARKVLASWEKGAPGAQLTEEAKGSLQRLVGRDKSQR